ncbi:MAG: pkn1 8 [Gemmataceae bacterium]|nr:pkn1 8 [Gemmataceae bacterium]
MAEPDAEADPAGGRRETGRRTRSRVIGRDALFAPLTQTAVEQPKTLTNAAGMAFVLVPEGTFEMGSPADEPDRRSNEGPRHEVVIGRPFYLAVHPVIQRVYQMVVGRNPSKFTTGNGGGPDHPVEMVSWDDAAAFCRQLAELPEERAAGRTYRLPTEAEWEYACRAGKRDSPFGHGSTFSADLGNFDAVYPYGDAPAGAAVGRTTPAGRYPANAWGLHDTHGTVWEWCADWYAEGYYAKSPARDPAGPPTGRFRVLRGGSWRNQAAACRAAYRNALAPHMRDSATGFRVVSVLGERGA